MSGVRTLAAAAAFLLPAAAMAWRDPPPPSYGRVVIDRFSSRAGMAPVQFDHWRHRARHTCRLCHVDIGFAMAPRGTEISASTNRRGFHCGACHDGKRAFDAGTIFPSCEKLSGEGGVPERCARCHSRGDAARRRKEYDAFAATMPRNATTGFVDWEQAEASGRVQPIDQLEGVSIPRPPLEMDKDVVIASFGWMTDVIFSHRKHAVWNGCEVCHPEVFPPRREGKRRATMLEISSGRSCGACHGKVAFSLGECQRCHVTEPMPLR